MFFSRCPNHEELEHFAVKPDAARVAKHLLSCAACRQAVEQIYKDQQTLTEVRQAASETLDERVRGRILSICLKVAENPEREGRAASEPGRAGGACA